MRRIALIAAMLGLTAAGAAAAADGHGMSHSASFATADAAAMSEGVVRKIDKTVGKITIAHGPLANLGMPGMTMAFGVGDPAFLEQVKAGDKIRFVAERRDGAFVVTTLEAAH